MISKNNFIIKKRTMSKSILIYLLFTVISTGIMAQSIDDIKDLVGKNQWDKAKEAVDKHLANEKNSKKGDGWYWKAVIYNSISRDENLSKLNPDARMEAFNAYKKYLELDSKMTMGLLSQHAALFDVCFGYLEEASKAFNNKEYEQSLNQFKNAEKVEDFIVSKGFTYGEFGFPAFDTQLYLNIAASATQAKKEDLALEYYMKIADKKIVDKGFDEIYRYIVDRLIRKGDKTKTAKYIGIGRERYPNDPFWCEAPLIEAGEDHKKMFVIYEILIKDSICGNYQMRYNYAVDLFNYCYAGDSTLKDYDSTRKKLTEILTSAISLQSTTG